MKDKVKSFYPRAVKPVPDPLGYYIRPEHRDQSVLLDFFAANGAQFSGVIFNPAHFAKQKELHEQVLQRNIDAILDPKIQEMSTPGMFTEKLGELPWGLQRQYKQDDFKAFAGKRIISNLSDFSIENGFTQVIAPTHYLKSADDEWFDIDIRLFDQLRNQINKSGDGSHSLIYELTIPYAVFRNFEQRRKIINILKTINIDMLWLKIDGLGSDNTANKTCNYLAAATDFHALGIPIVADHIGGLPGLALLAFGSVGGLAHGITLRERFAASSWHRPRKSGGFLKPRRIYFHDLDFMMDSKDAERILENHPKAKRLFSCRDKSCCHRGVKDMFEDPARHFLIQRGKQLNSLNGIPEQLRPQEFLNKQLLPLTDRVLKAANYDWGDETKMAKNLQEHRKRLDKTRISLGEYMEKSLSGSYSLHPVPRAIREATNR